MSNFLDAAGQAARSGVCSLLGLPNYVNDMIERVGFPAYNNPLVAIPNFWRNALCDTPPPNPNPSPFAGGQCEIFYNVSYRFIFTRNSDNQQFDISGERVGLRGPISQSTGQVAEQFVLIANTSDQGAVVLTGANNQTNTINEARILSVTPTNPSDIDNCGDPNPEYEDLEPGDTTFNTNITFNNALGVAVIIPVVFVYARAQILANGQLIIPFTLNLSGGVAFQGSVSLDGTVNFNFVPSGSGTAPKDGRKCDCGDISLPDGEVEEDPTDSDQPDQPDRDETKVIKGVLVTVTQISDIKATAIAQDENPDIYAPSLGYVNFLCRIGRTSGGWTVDLPVKNRRCLIQCPWDDGAVEVRGTPQPGVTWVLTPIYGYAGQPVEYVQ